MRGATRLPLALASLANFWVHRSEERLLTDDNKQPEAASARDVDFLSHNCYIWLDKDAVIRFIQSMFHCEV